MVEDNPPASLNPTAAIADLLLKHGVGQPWIETASQSCWRKIAALDSTAFHTLMPAITFLQFAPDRTQAEHELQRIATRLAQPGVIELDPYAEREKTPVQKAARELLERRVVGWQEMSRSPNQLSCLRSRKPSLRELEDIRLLFS